MRIGELLVRAGLITVEQVSAALRTQAQYGGKLGSILVELGWLDADALAIALGKQLGVPAASKKHFNAIERTAVALLSARAAERHRAIPLGWSTKHARQLIVAFEDPRNFTAIDEVSVAVGARVQPCVAPEVRIRSALQRHYDVQPKSGRFVAFEPYATIPGASEPPVVVSRAMKRAPSSARLELSMPPPSRQLSLRPVLGIDEACAAVERAGTIDEVGDALVDFLPSHFRVGLVLVVRGELLHGFRGFAPFVDPDVIKRLSLPLASTHLSRAPWACAPGPDPLYRLIGCDAPDVAVAMPIAIASRTVNIVYGHGERGAILPRWAVDDLRRICEVASAAYARITRVRAVASR